MNPHTCTYSNRLGKTTQHHRHSISHWRKRFLPLYTSSFLHSKPTDVAVRLLLSFPCPAFSMWGILPFPLLFSFLPHCSHCYLTILSGYHNDLCTPHTLYLNRGRWSDQLWDRKATLDWLPILLNSSLLRKTDNKKGGRQTSDSESISWFISLSFTCADAW